MLGGIRARVRRLGRKTPPLPPRPPFFEVLEQAVAKVPSVRRIAVLSGRQGPPVLRWLAELAPDAEVHRLSADLTPSQLHVQMAAIGRFDLIVDTTSTKERYARAAEMLMRLSLGGAVVVRALPAKMRQRSGRGSRRRGRTDRRQLAELFGALGHAQVLKSYVIAGKLSTDAERLGLVIKSVELVDGHLIMTSGREVLAKIREEQVDFLLSLKGEEWGRVHLSIEPTTFSSSAAIRFAPSEFAARPAESYDVPAMALREYREVTCRPGQVATKDNVVLPDTFRHNQSARLSSDYLTEVSLNFAFLPDDTVESRLAGDYFYLDSEVRGHFGHMMTEVVSRLWAWPQAKAAAPDLKALMFMNKNRHLAEFEVRLFAAAGIAREDIVFCYEPVTVERLWAATPMFSHPDYVHPELATVWNGMSDHLAAGASADVVETQRFFVSRRIAKRPCRNQHEVEELFVAHGFELLFPEDHPLEDQVAMFRSADVIAGFAGSGLFNLAFARSPKQVIIVSSESYTATNEHMMAAVLGHEVDVAWCRTEAQRTPDGRWRRGSFHAGFHFEHDSASGKHLRQVLTALDQAR